MAQEISRKTYGWVWLWLLILLFLTWVFSRINLGAFNVAMALTIAFAKMLLIILYFMHVRHSRSVIWVFVGLGFLWFLILVELTMTDYVTRGDSWSQ